MRITIFRNIGKDDAIKVIAAREKGKKARESDADFVRRILPSAKGKQYQLTANEHSAIRSKLFPSKSK